MLTPCTGCSYIHVYTCQLRTFYRHTERRKKDAAQREAEAESAARAIALEAAAAAQRAAARAARDAARDADNNSRSRSRSRYVAMCTSACETVNVYCGVSVGCDDYGFSVCITCCLCCM
jgi:hypothetical protein